MESNREEILNKYLDKNSKEPYNANWKDLAWVSGMYFGLLLFGESIVLSIRNYDKAVNCLSNLF